MAERSTPASLTSIPLELRWDIYKRLLPNVGFNTLWNQDATRYGPRKTTCATGTRNKDHGDYSWVDNSLTEHQYSILYVNKQINAEVKQPIHSSAFQMTIDQGFESEEEYARNHPDEEHNHPFFLHIYPGIDFGEVRQLIVLVELRQLIVLVKPGGWDGTKAPNSVKG